MTVYACPKPTKRLPAERKRVSKVSKRPSAKDRATADRLCAALVKQRAGNKCEHCGRRGTLDWAHGIGRKVLAVRWAHANGFALERTCHAYFTANPPMWNAWLVEKLGLGRFRELMRQAVAPPLRVDMSQVISDLRQGRTQLERDGEVPA